MLWFSKKKADAKKISDLTKAVTKQVAKHDQRKAEVIKEATETGERFRNTVVANGFTLRIHVAAGGKR